MGRGKVEVKRIEDKSNRQVTFSKRRSGLMKKARELSVLCDVDVAVHIFSGRGRLYEFASGESLRKIFERFEGQRSTAESSSKSAHDPREAKHKLGAEYRDMWTISDHLEMIQRQLEGQKVEQLNMAELTRIELQLDALLQQTRIKKEEKHQREANEATEEQITAAEINDHQTPAPPPMQLPPGPSTTINNQ